VVLDERLDELDRDQLEALVRRLLARAPELADLVYLPLPGEQEAVDGTRIASQVAGILLTMGDDWRASTRAERELWPLIELGTQYLEAGAVDDARVVFAAITDTILEYYESIRDEESEVAGIVDECVKGLGRCLEVAEGAEAREAVLRDAFAVYRWDALEHGGYGMDAAPRAVLLSQTTAEERTRVAGWVRQALSLVRGKHAPMRRQWAGRFLLALLPEPLSDDELERLYVEADMDNARLALLLAQGREDEAVALVRAATADSLIDLANGLVGAGLVEAAHDAVRSHAAALEPDQYAVRRWLVGQGVAMPANLDALVEALRWFRAKPDIGPYERLRAEAQTAGRWSQVLGMIVGLDPDRKRLQPVRARIHAELGDVERALAELEGLSESGWKSAALAVALTFEGAHPTVSAGLYRRVIEGLEAHGTKAARKQAAALRERVCAMEARG